VHTGDYRYDYSSPRRLVHILKTFPDLVVDAAHLGGWSTYDIGYDILHEELLGEERLFVDASSSFSWIGRRHMRELIRMWGADRVMFGSDYPMWDPAHELNEMLHCDLTDDELELVLWKNAEAFTGVAVA
jgi:predicted TIM-barrel fold metal-dependent hydrolase